MFGISALEWRVLATLCDEDALTIGDLARKVVAQQPTLTKAIKRMEEAGLVERGSDDADLRRTLAIVTKAGRRLAETLIERALLHEAQWLKGFSTADVETVRRVLQIVIVRRQSPLPFLDT
jgi:DNA-binding MarR family transcriptional regulator